MESRVQNNKEDLILVQDTLEGRKESFGKLIDKYKNLVFGLCLRILGNYADAEDNSQEVFIQAYKHIKDLKVNTKFYSWIYSITINTCKNNLKKKSKTSTVQLDDSIKVENPAVSEDIEKEISSQYDNRKKVAKILEILPVKYRIPFFLRYLEDRNYEEISRLTKLPLGTVKTYIHRAFNILINKKTEIETF